MGYKINSVLASLALLVAYCLHRQRRRNLISRQHGCQPLIKFWPIEPLSGFDFHLSVQIDVSSMFRYHQRYGKTFEVGSLIGKTAIITIAPENFRSIYSSRKDWGIEPSMLPAIECFCGHGFLTTHGAMWQHSRKLLKPTFNKANLLDLAALSAEVDQFISNLPADGSTVDLQPMLFMMVCG